MGKTPTYNIKETPANDDLIFGSSTADNGQNVNFTFSSIVNADRSVTVLDTSNLATENIDNVSVKGVYQFQTGGSLAITAPKYDSDNKLIRDTILGFNMYANTLQLIVEVFTDLEDQSYIKQTLSSFYDGETYVRTKRGTSVWGTFKRITTTL